MRPSRSWTPTAAAASRSAPSMSPAMRWARARRSRASPSRPRSPSHSSSRKARAIRAERAASSALNASSDDPASRRPCSTVFSGTSPLEKWCTSWGSTRSSRPACRDLEQLRVAAVERAALARRERGVEHVADDPARERQAVAARLALLLEVALDEQPVEGVVDLALRERLEVAHVEAPAEHRRDREKLPQLLGQPLDALLHRLLDRRRQRVRGERGLAGERPLAGQVRGDAPRVDQRADELLGEEGVPLRAFVEPLGEAVGEPRAADERLDERAVLGGEERAERDGGEAAVAAEALEHLGERVAPVHLGRAVAADHERRRRPEAAHDVLQRLDRDLGRVQVLQGEDERLAPAIRVSVRASSSKTCVWFSAPLAPLRAVCAPPLAASRISTISVSIGKSASRSGARSEKSAAAELPESR